MDRIVASAVQHHIEGIELRGLGDEIDVTKLLAFSVSVDQTISLLRAAGIQVPCLSTSVALVCPAGSRWQGMLEECQRHAELAAALGSPFVRVFGGSATGGLSDDEALILARRRIRQVVKLCRPYHCRPIIETHDAWSTAARMLELLDGLSPDEVGVAWNIEHSFRANQACDNFVETINPFLAYVHVRDSLVKDRQNAPMLLGEGEIPLKQSLKALQMANYRGWISLETDKRWQPDAPAPLDSIPQFAAFMRSHLNIASPRSAAGAS